MSKNDSPNIVIKVPCELIHDSYGCQEKWPEIKAVENAQANLLVRLRAELPSMIEIPKGVTLSGSCQYVLGWNAYAFAAHAEAFEWNGLPAVEFPAKRKR